MGDIPIFALQSRYTIADRFPIQVQLVFLNCYDVEVNLLHHRREIRLPLGDISFLAIADWDPFILESARLFKIKLIEQP